MAHNSKIMSHFYLIFTKKVDKMNYQLENDIDEQKTDIEELELEV